MTLNDPFAFEISTSLFVKIISLDPYTISIKYLDSDNTKCLPIDRCRTFLKLPTIINQNIDIFSKPVLVKSINSSAFGHITGLNKSYISVNFDDCGYTSIRVPFSTCESTLLMPPEISNLILALRKTPRSVSSQED